MAALAALIFAGCVTAPPLEHPTSSGYAEGIFRGMSTADAANKIVGSCAAKGSLVLEQSANMVVCARETNGSDALIATMAIGNAYSTTPLMKIRFVIFQTPDGARVTVQPWLETQMPGGQVNRMDVRGPAVQNALQKRLYELGAE